MLGFSSDLGIDLGTANILVYRKGRGIMLREPTVAAVHKRTRELRAVGEEARMMLGRTPTTIEAIQPIRDGVIADYTVTTQMLRAFIHKAIGKKFFFHPRVVISIPAGITGVERRAVLDATRTAGAKEVYPIEETVAAAIGAGLSIGNPEGSLVVDIGGGTTDIAVLSLGGIVKDNSVRIGGNKFDEVINRHVKKEHDIMIGERTAEQIKMEIGSAFSLEEELTYKIQGRDKVTGMPKDIVVTSQEIRQALADPLRHIVEHVRSVLEQTPPELASDIMLHGICLTGGGALLRGIDKLIEQETGIRAYVAEDPLSCVAIGAGKALDHVDVLERISDSHGDLDEDYAEL